MATLERVITMKQRGMSEQQIAQSLREEGYSPKEITDALSQSKIKGAIDFNHNPDDEYPEINQPVRDMAMQQGTMRQSIMSQPAQNYENYPEENFQQQSDQQLRAPYSEGEFAPEQSAIPQEYQEYYPEQSYQEYQPPQTMDIETMNEIAEQISEEKSQKLIKVKQSD